MDVTEAKPASSPASRDLQCVDASQWPTREFPAGVAGRVPGVVPVVLRQSIVNHIHLHGQQTTEVEICGVLVGRGYRDEQGPFIYIEGAIRGDHAESQVAQVTFTAETWNHIYAIADNAWPEGRILGWYHTHPGFGIFLSGMDLFIHDNFFNSPEQFAIVYDPLSGEEGIFLWKEGKATRAEYLVEPDAPTESSRSAAKLASATAGAGMRSPDDLAAQVTQLRSQVSRLKMLILLVGVLALAWPWLLSSGVVAEMWEKLVPVEWRMDGSGDQSSRREIENTSATPQGLAPCGERDGGLAQRCRIVDDPADLVSAVKQIISYDQATQLLHRRHKVGGVEDLIAFLSSQPSRSPRGQAPVGSLAALRLIGKSRIDHG
jgi:proteasome lid subunit RPN8/RPN11